MLDAKMLKILAVGDAWVPVATMVEYLRRDLVPFELEFITYEVEIVAPGGRGESSRLRPTVDDPLVEEYEGDPQDLIDGIGDVDILFTHLAPVTQKVLEAAPRLIAIGCTRSDPVSVNVQVATERGIPVFHAKGRSAEPVADYAIAMMLAVSRNICRADAFVRSGRWERYTLDPNVDCANYLTHFQGPRLAGSTVGIIGYGKIGRRVAKRLRGWDVNLLVYDPYVKDEDLEYGRKVELSTLLREAQFITIHVPPSPHTQHLIGAEQIALMRQDAYLVNTARGSVVDQEALYEALREKRIAGAALDVYEVDPLPSNSLLLDMDNVVLTPHAAGMVTTVADVSCSLVTVNLGKFLRGESFENLINPHYTEHSAN
jgi:phosphoglycerate dehydrogenase-like enzyme